MENDILETNEDKVDFLIGEIEVANTKISELMKMVNNQTNRDGSTTSRSKRSTSRSKQKEHLFKTLDSELRKYEGVFQNRRIQNNPRSSSERQSKSPISSYPKKEIEDYKAQIESLKNENDHLKGVIKKRTEDANTTIMKLAKMKKDTEEQNMEYLKTIQILIENQKSLKNQLKSVSNTRSKDKSKDTEFKELKKR
mmetsp:Transcript_31461/g.27821  ORF Transcript_31461/g.27821 Transcript_31461/m.27821 type:complete len:196 (+) Transcript_31461:272-859(+)